MTLLKKIKGNIKKIYFCFLGLFWISLIIYFRLIQEKNSYTLEELKTQVTTYIISINIVFTVCHLLLILYALYLIFIKVNDNKINNTIVSVITKVLQVIIIKPIIYLRDLVSPHIPGSVLFFCKITEYLDKFELSTFTKILKTIVIFFNFLPRIIVSLIFFIELVFYNRIFYFFTSLLLLIIPLCWNIFLSLYITFGERLLKNIPTCVEIIPIGEPLSNGWYTSYIFKPLDKFKYEEGEVEEYGDTYIIAIKIYSFGLGKFSFTSFQKDLTPYILLLTSSLYLSASIFKLLYLFF